MELFESAHRRRKIGKLGVGQVECSQVRHCPELDKREDGEMKRGKDVWGRVGDGEGEGGGDMK